MNIVLVLHNLNRWVVVVMIVAALGRAYSGWLQKKAWTDADRLTTLLMTIALDMQLLLGLVLYVGDWLPLWRDAGTVMNTPVLRLFALEHPFYGLLAVAAAHMGSLRAKKAPDDAGKHRTFAIFFSIVAVLLIILMPWSRPLLRGS